MSLRRARLVLLLALSVAAAGLMSGCGTEQTAGLNVVSIGDSLALGVQPQLFGGDRATSQGYPRAIADVLRKQGRTVSLHELGCGGATSGSVIDGSRPCAPKRHTPYRNEDPLTSQLAYAEGLLSRLGGKPTVIVLDVGGNDVGSCLNGGAISTTCIQKAGRNLRKNLGTILTRLRAVAPTVPIAVLDLYDPFLGLWQDHPEGRTQLVKAHAVFLREVNAAIDQVSVAHGAVVGKLGDAMQQSTPFAATQTAVPAAVTAVCRNTWMCVNAPLVPDIHLRGRGYRLAAQTMLRALAPSLKRLGPA
ncbi:MAG: SGNH/GDSL hydrolase family protein [Solirubrobacteraceae bacterium]|nr:SGNH/GDSL hydrolase family protein [Patulibacter sp.]